MASGDPDGDFLLKALTSKSGVIVKKPKEGDYSVEACGVEVILDNCTNEYGVYPYISHIRVGERKGSVNISVSRSWLSELEKMRLAMRDELTASLYVDAIVALREDGKENKDQGAFVEITENQNK